MRSQTSTQSKSILCTISPQYSDMKGLLDRYNSLCDQLATSESATQALLKKSYLSPQDIIRLDKNMTEGEKIASAKSATESFVSSLNNQLIKSATIPTQPSPTSKQQIPAKSKVLATPSAGVPAKKLAIQIPGATQATETSFSLLPPNVTPKDLTEHKLAQGFQHINVSGAQNNCGLRAVLLCIASHFDQLPESLKEISIDSVTDHFNNQDKVKAQDFKVFLTNGIEGAKKISISHPKPTQRTAQENILFQALGALAKGMHDEKKLSSTAARDIQTTVQNPNHTLGNDAISDFLAAMNIPVQVVTFAASQTQIETVEMKQIQPENTSSATGSKELRDSRACIYLNNAHYQILIPKPLL